MGGQAEAPVDWKGLQAGITNAATQQSANNRLNTSSPFASQTFNPDGSTSTQFAGGLNSAFAGLQNQVGSLATPMDWSKFGPVGNGDSARNQAITSAYGQATSRLDPQWDQRMAQERTRLINQGLDPNSEAARNDLSQLGMQRNDAYSSAMNGAIASGQAAGDSVFRNNLLAQQNDITNALRARGQPIQELQQLQGFLAQPGYNTDNTTLQGAMGSAQLAQNAANQQRQDDQARAAREAQIASAGMGLAGAGLGAWGTAAAAGLLAF